MKTKYKLRLLMSGCCIWCAGYITNLFAQTTKDSVTVNVAYGEQESWKTTSALSALRGEKLMKTTDASLGNSLHGIIPGLTVMQQSGEPGYDFYTQNLYSRGLSSFVGGQKMLIFVDGFESGLDYLSSEEIESLTLLKDASALALYGARGANGVLLVTTKKGRISSPHIGIRLQTGLQTPTFMGDVINSYDYAKLYNQALQNDGLSSRYDEAELAAYKNGTNPYLYPNVNWKKEMLKNSAPLTFAEMSFRGGNNVLRYYVMAGLMQNSGIYKGTDSKRKESSNAYYARFNFRANLDINISPDFVASLYTGAGIGDKSGPGGGISANELIKSIWGTTPNAFPAYNPNGTFGGNSSFTNPVGNLTNRGLYKENSRSLQTIFTLKYDFDKLIKGFKLSAGIGYNNYMADTSPKNRDYARYSLKQTGVDTDNNPVYQYTQYGVDAPLTSSEGFKTDFRRMNFKMQADYGRMFGDHGVDAMLMFISDLFKEYGVRHDTKYLNYGGRLTYNYQKTYIAEFTGSYMGTDNFAPGNRFGFFPAVSAAWIVSNENFLKNIPWLDFLKARISYGLIGNNQTDGRFLFDATYGSKGSYLFGVSSSATSGFKELTLANSKARWERKTIFNLGFDAALLKDLRLTFDWFNEEQKDILARPYSTIPGFVGASYGSLLPYMNVGRVKNQGFELSLRYDGEIKKDMTYHIEAGTWFARSEVKEMGETIKPYDYLYQKGQSVWKPIVLIADGLYQESDFDMSGNLKTGYPVPQYGRVAPGDIKYIDQNGDMIIDSNDSYPVKYSSVPEWNHALQAGFKWKSFSVDVLFNAVTNREIFLSGNTIYSFQDNGTASVLALDSWTKENPNATYPRLSTTSFENNYRTSTFWKRDGSFLRLRNLRVAYSLPESITQTLKLRDIEVYANATNIFTIHSLGELGDPEMNSLTNYPIMKSFNVGLKVNF